MMSVRGVRSKPCDLEAAIEVERAEGDARSSRQHEGRNIKASGYDMVKGSDVECSRVLVFKEGD